MAEEKFILMSLDDEKTKHLADILSNKTCKKIIEYLAESKEASEKDLSDKIEIPINTVEYNLKKLLDAGFVQKRKNFFWSKKGKKILMYELTNKSIIISPKNTSIEKIKSILPSAILLVAGTFAIFAYEKIVAVRNVAVENLAASSGYVNSPAVADKLISTGGEIASSPVWMWFFAGGLLALIIFSLVNWRKL